MKIGFVSLGCPKNQLDTEVMLHEILQAGYEITPEDIEADVIIVNTCAFIESAKQEAIDNILDVAWLKKHRKLKAIIVTGCLAERYGEEIFKELPEVDAVLGVGSIHNIVEAIEAVTTKKKKGSKQKYFSHEDCNLYAKQFTQTSCSVICGWSQGQAIFGMAQSHSRHYVFDGNGIALPKQGLHLPQNLFLPCIGELPISCGAEAANLGHFAREYVGIDRYDTRSPQSHGRYRMVVVARVNVET